MTVDNPDLVRKGAIARDRIAYNPEVAAACDDLARLADFGALRGVAEILRERLRQVEKLGLTPEHDDGFPRDLASMASLLLARVNVTRQQGTADIGSDEESLRQAGALAAAEMDRMYRLVTEQVRRGERHPELGIITPDMTGTDYSAQLAALNTEDLVLVEDDSTSPAVLWAGHVTGRLGSDAVEVWYGGYAEQFHIPSGRGGSHRRLIPNPPVVVQQPEGN